jgi:hypothetical protein
MIFLLKISAREMKPHRRESETDMGHVVFALPSFKDMTEPIFLDHLRSPGIDSQPGGPVPQHTARQAAQAGGTILRNRFLGFINVYKYGLWFLWTC